MSMQAFDVLKKAYSTYLSAQSEALVDEDDQENMQDDCMRDSIKLLSNPYRQAMEVRSYQVSSPATNRKQTFCVCVDVLNM